MARSIHITQEYHLGRKSSLLGMLPRTGYYDCLSLTQPPHFSAKKKTEKNGIVAKDKTDESFILPLTRCREESVSSFIMDRPNNGRALSDLQFAAWKENLLYVIFSFGYINAFSVRNERRY